MKVAAILLISTLCLTRGKNIEEIEVNDDPSQAKTICAQPESDGVLVAHENCNQFYKCSQSLPVALDCPAGLLYNPAKLYCNWANSVDCGDRVIPEVDDTDSENNDKPENNNPDGAPAICVKPESDGVLVAHENCNQFYKCFEGQPVAIACPEGLLYNPTREYCDWPKNVECGKRVIPEDDSESENDSGPGNDSNPDGADAICAKPESNGVLVPHENCNQFNKCSEGKPIAISCPENLHYNILKEYCDWPKNVECGSRVIIS